MALNRWFVKNGRKALNFGVIQQNPEKSKHLETAAVQIGSFSVDFSNLRTENYTADSRIPGSSQSSHSAAHQACLPSLLRSNWCTGMHATLSVIAAGTPEEDALRRDLTINSLYYNVNTGLVEDFTNRGNTRACLFYPGTVTT
jgi:tRNA nucleotidyltransferase (CCA-adding enzyme)